MLFGEEQCIGEGNGNPLQYSYLENPRDGGAWWAAIYGVTQSWTRLKQLSSSSSNIDDILKSRDIILLTKVHLVKATIFQAVMYGCESWIRKNWCFCTVELEKILKSPLDRMESKAINSKGNQPWIFIGRTNAKDCCEELTHWKTPWSWKRLEAKGEESDRERNG